MVSHYIIERITRKYISLEAPGSEGEFSEEEKGTSSRIVIVGWGWASAAGSLASEREGRIGDEKEETWLITVGLEINAGGDSWRGAASEQETMGPVPPEPVKYCSFWTIENKSFFCRSWEVTELEWFNINFVGELNRLLCPSSLGEWKGVVDSPGEAWSELMTGSGDDDGLNVEGAGEGEPALRTVEWEDSGIGEKVEGIDWKLVWTRFKPWDSDCVE